MAKKNDLKQIKQVAMNYLRFLKNEINLNIIHAYLYGSVVKGTYNENSDIDLAIISDEFKGDRFEDIKKIYKYVRNFDVRIEPMPFSKKNFDKSNPFVNEIINTGIQIL